MAKKSKVETLIERIEQKVSTGQSISDKEERFVLKHRDNLSETEIDFTCTILPTIKDTDSIIY